jgi:Zn-dependent protease/CBS domain-containing protein
MKSSFRLFRIAGIDIGVHYTWIFIFIFISWSLAMGFFPAAYPGWDTLTYWITGIIAALMLFVSVLLHELAHSLVAKRRGIPVNSITLFFFGGVSNLEEEPKKPMAEFTMAIVGPGMSLVLALIFYLLFLIPADKTSPLAAMLNYLALINLILAVFNLLPGFPLDGGRVLRSIIWGATGDLVKATNIAGRIGQILGWALIGVGIYFIFFVSIVSGLWMAFIGWFLSGAASASRREATVRQSLSGVRVRDFVDLNTATITPETTVSEMVSSIFRRQHGRAVPVCRDGKLLGIVTITDVRELPQEKWATTPVADIMTREPLYTASPQDDLNTVLKLLAQHDINQVPIQREGQCVGLLSRADIIRHLQFREELGMGKS